MNKIEDLQARIRNLRKCIVDHTATIKNLEQEMRQTEKLLQAECDHSKTYKTSGTPYDRGETICSICGKVL